MVGLHLEIRFDFVATGPVSGEEVSQARNLDQSVAESYHGVCWLVMQSTGLTLNRYTGTGPPATVLTR